MKLEPDDPRLTAYVLGECPPEEAAQIARAVAADPALAIAMREIESIERLLSETLSGSSRKLSPRQRNAVLAAAREVDVLPATHLPVRRQFHLASWLAPLAAAALIVLGFALFVPDSDLNDESSLAIQESPQFPVSMLPAPSPVDASASTSGVGAPAAASIAAGGHPVLRPRGPVSAAHHPLLPLPIQSGNASVSWIREAILDRGKLPSPDAVRAEEVLNHFRIRPVGATAIHKGITLTVETLPCAWNPSASLAVVALRGARENVNEVTLTWHADTEAVWRYRLLGHAHATGVTPKPLARTLNAAAEHIVVIEIEPSSANLRGFGGIEWTINGEPAPSLAVASNPRRTPSIDARYAAFICTVAQWFCAPSSESSATMEALVRTLLQEVESDPPFPKRVEFNQLVRRALDLAVTDPE